MLSSSFWTLLSSTTLIFNYREYYLRSRIHFEYCIYPCIRRTFFPLKKLRKLGCVLYTTSVDKYTKFVHTQSFAFNWKVKDITNEEITISIDLKSSPFLFNRTTDQQGIKMAAKFEEKRIRNVVAWGDVAACLFMTPLKLTWLKMWQ